MAGLITQVEADYIAEAILSGVLARGDAVECVAGLFTVGAVERRAGDIHVVMVQPTIVDRVNVAFRVGGDDPSG